MATLAPGRIDLAVVEEEIERLRLHGAAFAAAGTAAGAAAAAGTTAGAATAAAAAPTARAGATADARFAALDRFDRVQLADVLAVCAASSSLSEAGRMLFASSRAAKKSTNDADRLRKYLARFGLDFAAARLSQ